jgi:hypothetical protein
MTKFASFTLGITALALSSCGSVPDTYSGIDSDGYYAHKTVDVSGVKTAVDFNSSIEKCGNIRQTLIIPSKGIYSVDGGFCIDADGETDKIYSSKLDTVVPRKYNPRAYYMSDSLLKVFNDDAPIGFKVFNK